MKNEVEGQEEEREDPEKKDVMVYVCVSLCMDKNACCLEKKVCVASENMKSFDVIFICYNKINWYVYWYWYDI